MAILSSTANVEPRAGARGAELHALDTVRKLRLSRCGEIGEYLGVDANVVRLVWVILVFVIGGVAVAAHVATWIFLSWAMCRR